ncbi:MAG: pyridoxal phosphate-dependent aminotransferase [Deltaproteobacteria bacterium]|nr:pyridoxal phosphate-dependent aminotransferase [Deltaproteobacteria bacterium]
MAISRKIEGYLSQSSWIRKMFEAGIALKQKHGADKVFDFSLGNPNIDPPRRFEDLLKDAAADHSRGLHGYMPNAGYPETRKAVAEYLSKQHDLTLAADHIIMTCGAGGALNVILKTILEQGDEVIIPTPYFVEYRFYIDNHGGCPVLAPTKDDFSLDIEAIEKLITRRTKAVLINSPNNPTGVVYDRMSIDKLTALLNDKSAEIGHSIYLMSDEPYRDIVYDGIRVPSILAAYQNSLIATSYSKNLSIPGERIGYVAVNSRMTGIDTMIGGLVLCNRILGFVNAPAMMQRIVARMQGVVVDVEQYRKKRDLFCEGLAEIGYKVRKPQGAFYLFQKTPIDDDVKFVSILQKHLILTVPGSGFGGPGHMRIAYCVDDDTIVKSMKGFEAAFKECRS